MVFSGLGAGTSGDPFQITTVAQFNEMDGYANEVKVFTGSGLDDFSIPSAIYNGNGSKVFVFTICQVHGIKTSALNNGGSGYAVNDLFTVDG